MIKTLTQMINTKIKNIKRTILMIKETKKRRKMSKIQPPPERIKHEVVKTYAKNFLISIFVETGTYEGEMVNAIRKIFETIYSIELDYELYNSAKEKFSKYNQISIIQGDSSKILPLILSKIDQP